MLQCDAYYTPCVAPEPPTVVETMRVIQPPPRVVIVQPRIFVRPRRTVVIKRPPIYECGSSWSGCPSVRYERPYGPPPPPPAGYGYQSRGETFSAPYTAPYLDDPQGEQ